MGSFRQTNSDERVNNLGGERKIGEWGKTEYHVISEAMYLVTALSELLLRSYLSYLGWLHVPADTQGGTTGGSQREGIQMSHFPEADPWLRWTSSWCCSFLNSRRSAYGIKKNEQKRHKRSDNQTDQRNRIPDLMEYIPREKIYYITHCCSDFSNRYITRGKFTQG